LATFKNMKDLNKYLQKQIDDALKKEVADEVRSTMIKRIEEDVYEPYTPYSTDGVTPHYERTYELKNPKNIIHYMIKDGMLAIENIRQDTDDSGGYRDIVEILESGRGYDWGYKRDLDKEIGARPFVQNTRNELSASGRHKKALKSGLNKRGIKTL